MAEPDDTTEAVDLSAPAAIDLSTPEGLRSDWERRLIDLGVDAERAKERSLLKWPKTFGLVEVKAPEPVELPEPEPEPEPEMAEFEPLETLPTPEEQVVPEIPKTDEPIGPVVAVQARPTFVAPEVKELPPVEGVAADHNIEMLHLLRDIEDGYRYLRDNEPREYEDRDFNSVNSIIERHAAHQRISVDQMRKQARRQDIPFDHMIDQVSRGKATAQESVDQSRERGELGFLAPEERKVAARGAANRRKAMERFDRTGSAEDLEQVWGSANIGLIKSERDLPWMGITSEEVVEGAKKGSESHDFALFLAEQLLKKEEVSRLVETYGTQENGFKHYVDKRAFGYMMQRGFTKGTPEWEANYPAASLRAFNELAALFTAGAWHGRIIIPTGDLITTPEGREITKADRGLFSPTLEVVGMAKRGGRIVTVVREQGTLMHVADVLDMPQAMAVGMIDAGEFSKEAAVRGIEQRRHFLELAMDSEFADQNMATKVLAIAGGGASLIFFPDLLSLAGNVGKAAKLAYSSVKTRKGALRSSELLEQIFKAREENNFAKASEAEAALRREFGQKGGVADALDIVDAGVASRMVDEFPDLLDPEFAASLPGTMGQRMISLHASLRKQRLTKKLDAEGKSFVFANYKELFSTDLILADMQKMREELVALGAQARVPAARRVIMKEMEGLRKLLGVAGDADAARFMHRLGKSLHELFEDSGAWSKRFHGRGNPDSELLKIHALRGPSQDMIDAATGDAKKALEALAKKLRTKRQKIHKLLGSIVTKTSDIKDPIPLLDRAVESVKTASEARAAAAEMLRQAILSSHRIIPNPVNPRPGDGELMPLSDYGARFADMIEEAFGLSREEAEVAARITDARARAWASLNGKEIGKWYDTRIAAVSAIEDASDIPKTALKMAEEQGDSPIFYSRLLAAAETLREGDIKIDSVVNDLRKAPKGIPKNELKWTGFELWLQERKAEGAKTVTKQDVIQFLETHAIRVDSQVTGEAVEAVTRAQRVVSDYVRDNGLVDKMQATGLDSSQLHSLMVDPGRLLEFTRARVLRNAELARDRLTEIAGSKQLRAMHQQDELRTAGQRSARQTLFTKISTGGKDPAAALHVPEWLDMFMRAGPRGQGGYAWPTPVTPDGVLMRGTSLSDAFPKVMDEIVTIFRQAHDEIIASGKLDVNELDELEGVVDQFIAYRDLDKRATALNYSDEWRGLVDRAYDLRIAQDANPVAATKWEHYTVPGGEDYTEMTITLPAESRMPQLPSDVRIVDRKNPQGVHLTFPPSLVSTSSRLPWRWRAGDSATRYVAVDGTGQVIGTPADSPAAATRNGRIGLAGFFPQSAGHEFLTANQDIAVHVRFKTRIGANGEKVLFIEEIQSDWSQRARQIAKAAGMPSGHKITAAPPKGIMKAMNTRLKDLQAEALWVNTQASEAAFKRNASQLSDDINEELGKLGYNMEVSLSFDPSSHPTGIPDVYFRTWVKGALSRRYGTRPMVDSGNLSRITGDPATFLVTRMRELHNEQSIGINTGYYQPSQFPPTPFKDDWHKLMVKRVMRYAADNDFDSVAISRPEHITPLMVAQGFSGPTHATDRRWWEGEFRSLTPTETYDELLLWHHRNPYASLDEAEEFERSLRGRPTPPDEDDLSVYNGIKHFYEGTLPNYMKKYLRQWGGKQREMVVDISDAGSYHRGLDADAEQARAYGSDWLTGRGADSRPLSPAKIEELREQQRAYSVIAFDITDDMRTGLKRPAPLLQVTGKNPVYYSKLTSVAENMPKRMAVDDLMGFLGRQPNPKAGQPMTYPRDVVSKETDEIRFKKGAKVLDKSGRPIMEPEHLYTKGVKEEEIKWTNVEEFLTDARAQGKTHVTRKDFLEHLNENRTVVDSFKKGGSNPLHDAIEAKKDEVWPKLWEIMDDSEIEWAPEDYHVISADPGRLIGDSQQALVGRSVSLLDIFPLHSPEWEPHEALLQQIPELADLIRRIRRELDTDAVEIYQQLELSAEARLPLIDAVIEKLKVIVDGPGVAPRLLREGRADMQAIIDNPAHGIRRATDLEELVDLSETVMGGPESLNVFRYEDKVYFIDVSDPVVERWTMTPGPDGEAPMLMVEEGVDDIATARRAYLLTVHGQINSANLKAKEGSGEPILQEIRDLAHLAENHTEALRINRTPEFREFSRLVEESEKTATFTDPTKYSRWKLAGGHGYREVLIKTARPQVPSAVFRTWYKAQVHTIDFDELTRSQKNTAGRLYRSQTGYSPYMYGDSYHGPHWEEKNVLVHYRATTRFDDAGRRVLFIEEIQSDWHQGGRARGYSQAENDAIKDRLRDRLARIEAELDAEPVAIVAAELHIELGRLRRKFREAAKGPVPDGPFKDTKTWTDLAIKHIFRQAADEGYDGVAFTRSDLASDYVSMPTDAAQAYYDGTVLSRAKRHTKVSPETIRIKGGGTPRGIPGAHTEEVSYFALTEKARTRVQKPQVMYQRVDTRTPEFKAWSGGLPMMKAGDDIPEGGAIIEAYHGTWGDFDVFRTDESLGAHFGTLAAANDRAAIAQGKTWAVRPGMEVGATSVIPVYIRLKNPYRMPDMGPWNKLEILDELEADSTLDWSKWPGGKKGLEDYVEYFDYEEGNYGLFQEFLRRNGYDGVVYKNTAEGVGPGGTTSDSYIVFEPNQIKSKFNRKPTDDPRILYQRADTPTAAKPQTGWKFRELGDGSVELTSAEIRAARQTGEAPAPVFVERGLDGARAFDEIEGDPFVWVFHSTDGATADSFLSRGVRAGDKPQTVGQEMAARGEIDYAPGRGASDGLYVGGNTDDIPHARRFLAINVRRSELDLTPESSALGYDTVGGALNSQGAIIRGNVPAQNIVDVGVPGKYPNMTRIRETLAARPAPRAPKAPAAGRRIEESAGAAKLDPTFDAYLEGKRAWMNEALPGKYPKVNDEFIAELRKYGETSTEAEFLADRAKLIDQYVEKPAQPLVRQLLDEGHEPYMSNAYGPGDKGVWFTRADGSEGFRAVEAPAGVMGAGLTFKMERVGRVGQKNTMRIKTSELPKALQGRGMGSELYLRALQHAKDKGFRVASDVNPSPEAMSVYNKLQEAGVPIRRELSDVDGQEVLEFVIEADQLKNVNFDTVAETLMKQRLDKTKLGLYSGLRLAATKLPDKVQTDAVLTLLRKQGGVKADELKWVGVPGWLERMKAAGRKSLTRREIVQFMDENAVHLTVTRLSHQTADEIPADLRKALDSAEKATDAAWAPLERELRAAGAVEADIHSFKGGDIGLVERQIMARLSTELNILDSLGRGAGITREQRDLIWHASNTARDVYTWADDIVHFERIDAAIKTLKELRQQTVELFALTADYPGNQVRLRIDNALRNMRLLKISQSDTHFRVYRKSVASRASSERAVQRLTTTKRPKWKTETVDGQTRKKDIPPYEEILIKHPFVADTTGWKTQQMPDGTWEVTDTPQYEWIDDLVKSSGKYTSMRGAKTQDEAIAQVKHWVETASNSEATKTRDAYTHFHWQGHQNVLAHARLSERIDVDGNRVLFVEEIQSDWHQAGRVRGYKLSPEDETKIEAAMVDLQKKIDAKKATGHPAEDEMQDAVEQINKMYYKMGGSRNVRLQVVSPRARRTGYGRKEPFGVAHRLDSGEWPAEDVTGGMLTEPTLPHAFSDLVHRGVKAAPFSKNWAELAIKEVLRKAADEGYHSVAFNKGDVVKSVVGGKIEGQRYFYDEMVPKILRDYAQKQWGTPVQRIQMDWADEIRLDRLRRSVKADGSSGTGYMGMGQSENFADAAAASLKRYRFLDADEGVIGIRISDEMRGSINAGQTMFQGEEGVIKGAVQFLDDGKATIFALKQGDISTVVHELGHIFRRDLGAVDLRVVEKWAGVTESKWTAEAEEKFARAFERYLREGEAPDVGLRTVFEKLKVWLSEIYRNVVGTPIDVELTDEVRQVFKGLLSEQPPNRPPLKRISKYIDKELFGPPGKEGVNALEQLAAEALRVGATDSTNVDFLLSSLAKYDVIHFNKPVMGKTSWTKEDLAKLQSTVEAEVVAARRAKTPSIPLRSMSEAIAEETPDQKIRSTFAVALDKKYRDPSDYLIAGIGAIARASVATVLGGDEFVALRNLPPAVRHSVLAGTRTVEQAYGDMIRLVGEGDVDAAARFLGGETVKFKNGRDALSSGFDATGAVMEDMKRWATEAMSPKHRDALIRLARNINEVPAGRSGVGIELSADKETAEALEWFFGSTAGANAAPRLLKQIRESIEVADEAVRPSHEMRLVEVFLHHAGVTERAGEMSDARGVGMATALIDDIEQIYGKEDSLRMAVLFAGYGQAVKAKQRWAGLGMAINKADFEAYHSWLNGMAIDKDMQPKMRAIAARFGMNPNFLKDAALDVDMYIPAAARSRMAASLARGSQQVQVSGKLGEMFYEDKMRGAWRGMYQYLKTRMTRGGFFVRQRYFLMNTIDHFTQMAISTGFRPAFVSTIRMTSQNFMVLPGVAHAARLAEAVGVEKASERMRQVLQSGGDRMANTVGEMLGMSKYRIEVNPILEGINGTFTVTDAAGRSKIYKYRDIRDIAVEEGIFASFDTRALERSIKRAVNLQSDDLVEVAQGGRLEQAASNTKRITRELTDIVSETAEAWSERERLGAMITLMEAGVAPRDAARMTIDALYDYAGSMSKVDRHILVNLMFPFWAFQKNANRQILNAMFSPAGAYRMGVMRRAQEGATHVLTELLYERVSDPYGVDWESMPKELQDNYWALRQSIEYGYGPLEALQAAPGGDELVADLLHAASVKSIGELDPKERQFLENGFGGPSRVPPDVRNAIRAYFSGVQHGLADEFGDKRAPGGTVSIDRALANYMHRMMPVSESAGRRESIAEYYNPKPHPSARRGFLRDKHGVAITPRMHDDVRKFQQLVPDDHVYLEMYVPDSTINAGFRHAASSYALQYLAVRGIIVAGREDSAVTLHGLQNNLEAIGDPFGAPVPAALAETLTGEGARPRRVHPTVGRFIDDYIPFITVGKVEGIKDPWATDDERERDLRLAEAQKVAKDPRIPIEDVGVFERDRYYISPGIPALAFSTGPWGELNDQLLAWERAPVEESIREAWMLKWARGVIGLQTGVVSRKKSARGEMPRFLKTSSAPPRPTGG